VAVTRNRHEVLLLDAAALKPLGEPFVLCEENFSSSMRPLCLSPDAKELAATGDASRILRVRMFDQKGNFRRDLLLHTISPAAVNATLGGNGLVFLLCLWLFVRQSRRRHLRKGPRR
jgi:hypothetical protein